MRFLHISDLHIGKRVNEYSMLEEQKHVLKQILDYVKQKHIDCVLIAGDIYDKSVPPASAVTAVDEFLTGLSCLGASVCLISGNHDSQERLSFGSRIMEKQGIYIASRPELPVKRVEFSDSYGPVAVYLLPFLRPETVRPLFPEQKIESSQDAAEALLSGISKKERKRSILVAHQFVVSGLKAPDLCDSEVMNVGGAEAVDVSLFCGFSYVALGHLHGPQKVGKSTVRYAGSPVKYSFSEEKHYKSAVLVDLSEDRGVKTELLPLTPVHNMRTIRGPLEGLLSREVWELFDREDYIRAEVTDEKERTDVLGQLRAVYPNLMELSMESRKYRELLKEWNGMAPMEKSALELFEEFYSVQNGKKMDREERELFCSFQKLAREKEEQL